jgi:hypothetical protein
VLVDPGRAWFDAALVAGLMTGKGQVVCEAIGSKAFVARARPDEL